MHTCRLIEGGPIPWTAISAFADKYGLNLSDLEDLEHFIRVLDDRYLEIQERKRKEQVKKRG